MKSLRDARRLFPRLKLVRFNGRAAASLREGTKMWPNSGDVEQVGREANDPTSLTICLKATDRRRPVPCFENASPFLKKRVAPPPVLNIHVLFRGFIFYFNGSFLVTSSVFASFNCLCVCSVAVNFVCGRTQVSKRKRAIDRKEKKEKQTNKNLSIYVYMKWKQMSLGLFKRLYDVDTKKLTREGIGFDVSSTICGEESAQILHIKV